VIDKILGVEAVSSEVQATVSSTAELLGQLWDKLVLFSARIPVALVVLFISWLVIKRYRKILKAMLSRGKMDPILINLVLSGAVAAGWIVSISLVFSILGFNSIAIALSGSLGLIALGLASSANNVVSDLYGGISLIAESSIRVGRRIRAAGVEGRIIDMNIRKLRLIDDEGNIHIIPNKAVDGSTIVVIAENEESQS